MFIVRAFEKDDGIKEEGSLGDEQKFEIEVPNLNEGVYYVDFIKDDLVRDCSLEFEDRTVRVWGCD